MTELHTLSVSLASTRYRGKLHVSGVRGTIFLQERPEVKVEAWRSLGHLEVDTFITHSMGDFNSTDKSQEVEL